MAIEKTVYPSRKIEAPTKLESFNSDRGCIEDMERIPDRHLVMIQDHPETDPTMWLYQNKILVRRSNTVNVVIDYLYVFVDLVGTRHRLIKEKDLKSYAIWPVDHSGKQSPHWCDRNSKEYGDTWTGQ